jgi:hypothetical protein
MSNFVFEMDNDGHHRIVAPDGSSSPWKTYDSISMLDYQGNIYIAVSAYYGTNNPHSTCLMAETVYKVTKVDCDKREVASNKIWVTY